MSMKHWWKILQRKDQSTWKNPASGHAVRHKSYQNGLKTKPNSCVDRHNGYNKVVYITFPRQKFNICAQLFHIILTKEWHKWFFSRLGIDLRPTCLITLPWQRETICARSQPSVTQICDNAFIYLRCSSISICHNERTDTTNKRTEFTELSRPISRHFAK